MNRYGGIQEFLDYLETLPDMETKIIKSSPSGISVSFKKSDE